MSRYSIGVDWGDQQHGGCARDEHGALVWEGLVGQPPAAMSEWGRRLEEWRAAGVMLWAAIEKPEGRLVEFLLDHGVVVSPVNPTAWDRARDRFRLSAAKSDRLDARGLAEFLRTDHPHRTALAPRSEEAQEMKRLTRDYARLVRRQTRLLNQSTIALEEYYPRGGGRCLGTGRPRSRGTF